jgi:hypothetical protein
MFFHAASRGLLLQCDPRDLVRRKFQALSSEAVFEQQCVPTMASLPVGVQRDAGSVSRS